MRVLEDRTIVHEGAVALITPPYRPVVTEIVTKCRAQLPVRSILVRGSVSCGCAVPPYSDIDVVVVLERPYPEAGAVTTAIAKDAEQAFPFLESVDLVAVTLEQLREETRWAGLLLNVQVLSCVVDGENVLPLLGSARADRSVVDRVYGDLPEELRSLHRFFRSSDERAYGGRTRPVRFWCRWTMRTLLRAGVCLVFEKRPVFTTNLTEARTLIEETFPELASAYERVHALERYPSDDRNEIAAFLDAFLPVFLAHWEAPYARQ